MSTVETPEHTWQLEKFETIGRLAMGIAHDFNNLVGAIMGWSELGLAEVPPGSQSHRYYVQIYKQATRAANLTRQLLAYARRQALERRNVNLNDVIADARALMEKLVGEQVELKAILGPRLPVIHADVGQIEQALMNLCVNARDAMPGGGQLLLKTEITEIDEQYCQLYTYAKLGRFVLLSVSDTGSGMDAAILERVFEPFFTTKQIGHGTGLGLATVYGIVKQHGGFINAYSEVGQGTTFRLYFPAVQGKATEIEKVAEEPLRGGAETILVAEDHQGVREMATEVLSRLGYRVIAACDGEEAERRFTENHEQIDLILMDVFMPKLFGSEVYKRIREIRPTIPVIFTTGYTAESALPDSPPEDRTLQKPYTSRVLAQRLRRLLDGKQA